MENGKYVDGSLFFYAPNKVAPIIFGALFALSTLLHIYQCIHYRCWKVTGVLAFSAFLFVVGYIARAICAYHYTYINIYIVSVVFIYAAPPLYELANYFILSRILYYVPYHSPIHPGRVFTTFGALSSVVEILNGNGAANVATSSVSSSKANLGRTLLKVALILQLIILSLFVILAAFFTRRCKKAGIFPANLKAVLTTLYISSALIGTRTIYRTVEYFTTSDLNFATADPATLTPILRYEWYFWVFEAALMMTNTFLLNARHPLRFLPRDNKVYLAQDGVTEVLGPGYQDTRLWILTLIDPFDLMKMEKGRNAKEKFWENQDGGEAILGRENGKDAVEMERGMPPNTGMAGDRR